VVRLSPGSGVVDERDQLARACRLLVEAETTLGFIAFVDTTAK
jgi:hypothetical protein